MNTTEPANSKLGIRGMQPTFDHEAHTFRSPKFRSVVEEAIGFFRRTPIQPLPPPMRFLGGGVYAIYYIGGYDLYAKLTALNQQNYGYPIYVGKAVPPGWRTGRVSLSITPDLSRRLQEHAKSLRQVANLHEADFRCQFMILDGLESELVVPIEANLIRFYRPLWNVVVDGFGNHDPGSGRYNQAKSEWDVLHPGRYWAERLTGVSPILENIIVKIQHYFDHLEFP
jgi:hypothetical protein